MTGFDEFEEEYADYVGDIESAGFKTYEQKLKDFMRFLDQSTLSKDRIKYLESKVTFSSWYAESKASVGGMVGSGTLALSDEKEKRLGQLVSLFRHLSEKSGAFSDFATAFLTSGSHYDDMLYDINSEYFEYFSRELLKDIQRSAPLETKSIEVPASNRIVTIDHNTPEYKDLMDQITKIETAVSKSNEVGAKIPEERDRIAAEIGAGQRLLQAGRVRLDAIMAVLLPPLKWLADHFAGAVIGVIAVALLTALAAYLGITIPTL